MDATICLCRKRFNDGMISCQGVAMSIVAPQGRKSLSADALFRLVRSSFATITDERSGEVEIPFPEALMSAFALLFAHLAFPPRL